jgi:hypothetical protein
MTRSFIVIVAALLASAVLTGQQAPARPSGAPMVASVLAARRNDGTRFRATLTTTNMQTKAKAVRQLIVTARRSPTRSTTLYRVAWPPEASNDAWVIEDTGDHLLKGFRYEAGKFTALTTKNRPDRFAGSDLTLEDLEFAFWFWPTQVATGAEAVGEYDCTIVESRPAAGRAAGYARVKSWIAPALSVPLRIELFDADGQLAKRLGMYRILLLGDRWMPTLLTVEPRDGRSRTVIEGVRYEPGLAVTDADFSKESAQRPLAPSERQH